jgi:hypothetical protein
VSLITKASRRSQNGHLPEGDPSSSPGLLYSATLGKTANEFRNPNGVVARWQRTATQLGLPTTRGALPQPRWGCEIIAAIPKVAEYSNLGLWASTTTWLQPTKSSWWVSPH